MAKPNYHHAKRQKEMARKARQQDKQRRRAKDNPTGESESAAPAVADETAAVADPGVGSGA
jgi:hypothetical protein